MQLLCADSQAESTTAAMVEIGRIKSQNPRGKWRSVMIFDHRTL
jgi:hypothetical protein